MPELRALASLSFEAAPLAPFQRTMRDWTLFELLKADGLQGLGDIGRLTAQELRALPSIGEQHAEEVVDLLAWIGSTLGRSQTPESPPDLPVADIEVSSDRSRERDWRVGDALPSGSVPPTAAYDRTDAHTRTFADPASVGYQFPDLNVIAGLPLADPALRIAQTMPGDDLAHGWITRTGVTVIDDLLSFTRQDFLDARGLGPTKVSRLYGYLGRLNSAANSIASMKSDGSDQIVLPPNPHSPLTVEPSSPDPRVATIIDWAASVAGAQTWADAFSLVNASLPDDVARAWRGLLSEPLPSHASGSALAEFLESDSRRARVLLARVASSDPLTLQELAAEFGVTRERMRQIESKALVQMRDAFESAPEWRSVRWASSRLVEQAGSYAPGEALVEALPSWPARERHLVARLAGYKRSAPTLIAEGVLLPSPADLPLLDGTDFVVNEYELVEELHAIGVLPRLVDFALTVIGGVSRVDGQLVRWVGSVVDKAVAVLEVRDEPQEIEQLVLAVSGDIASRSTRNRIFEDPRTMRVTKTRVGLRRWGGSQYTTVVDLMRDRLSSGPMDLDDLADDLAQRYEVSPASVRMYGSAPMFKVTANTIALRSFRDPFVPRNKPSKVKGLYRDHVSAITVWCLAVDTDMLRGSGRAIPQEVAVDLGVAPGARTDLRARCGDIPVSWSESSNQGPQIGSIRELVETAGLREGDQIALRFHCDTAFLELCPATRINADASLPEQISAWTTLPPTLTENLTTLATTLAVESAEVIDVLDGRGDSHVATLARGLGSGKSAARALAPPQSDERGLPVTARSTAIEEPEGGIGNGTHPSAPSSEHGGSVEFDEAISDSLDRMLDARYDPTALRKLVNAVGAHRATEMLVGLTAPSESFVALFRLGRLDLTIEAHVACEDFRGLFTADLVERAVERLAEHDFSVDE